MRITLPDVCAIVHAGDVILVRDRKPGLIQEGIDHFERGDVNHCICCMGGTLLVEADAFGVQWSDLRNYLGGKHDLFIRRLRQEPTPATARPITDFWQAQVGHKYGYGFIVGFIPRYFGWKWAQVQVDRWLGSKGSEFCSMLGVMGLRQLAPVLPAERADAVSPEMLQNAPELAAVVTLPAPDLEDA